MIDAYLQRKSYLERYIRGVTAKQLRSFKKSDAQIIKALQKFMDTASSTDISALLSNNTRNKTYKELSKALDSIINMQTALVTSALVAEITDYISSEIWFTYKMFGSDQPRPKPKKIAQQVIAGATIQQTIKTVQSRTMERLRRDIAMSVQADNDPIQTLKGTRVLNYTDGFFFWRDNRIYKPTIDQLIVGSGWNAMNTGIKKIAPKTKFRWLGTLDGRMCKICAANEINSPYSQGKTPPFSAHPFCRCQLVPDIQLEGKRPFVASFKSVSKIPKNKRKGLIGQVAGNTTYAQWFATQDSKFQRKWLGKSRYESYKKGIYKLTDFVDPKINKVYTLKQLDKLHG